MEALPLVLSDSAAAGPVDLDLTAQIAPFAPLAPPAPLAPAALLARWRRGGRSVWPALLVLGIALVTASAITHAHSSTGPAGASDTPAVSLQALPDPRLWYNGWLQDGRWQVGLDVWPGVYRASVPAGPLGCVWTRYRRGADGLYAVAVGGAEPGGQASLIVSESDSVVQTLHCGWWHADPTLS